jgi:SAM-dependent methyltransferase
MAKWSTARRSPDLQPVWAGGYVVDTPYFEPVSTDICPASLSMAAVLHGQPPIDLSRHLTWVDLGCGSGLAACVTAAANANVTVWGCDLNPAHVERARHLAREARLENCTFDEASFEQLASDESIGPAQVDVIVLHGVYSWVSQTNQRHIVDFIARRLRPGGLVLVSYESATGWSSMVPIAEALRLHVDVDGRRSNHAFPDAVTAVARLASGGARNFPLGSHEAAEFEGLATANVGYAAHEYLGAHFQPLMFDDVSEAMDRAHCSFVGSIDATDHLSAYWVPPGLAEIVLETTDLGIRELVRDLATERPLRRDLFRRGMAAPTPIEQATSIEALSVRGLGVPLGEAVVKVPSGNVGLDARYYGPVLDALRSGPLDVARIRELHPETSPGDALGALCLLLGGSYAAASIEGEIDDGVRASARRLNEVLIAENRRGGDHGALVAPRIGSAVRSEYVEMLTLGAIWRGEGSSTDSLADVVVADLEMQGRRVVRDGSPVEDAAEARSIIEQRVASTLEKRAGIFAQLAIC